LAGGRLEGSDALRSAVLRLADSDDARVRFAVAVAAGLTRDPRAADALAAVARRDAGDRWMRAAVLCSAAEQAEGLLTRLAGNRSFAQSGAGLEIIEAIAEIAGARNRPDGVRRAMTVAAGGGREARDRLLRGLGRGLVRVGGRLDPSSPVVDGWLRDAEATAASAEAPEAVRVEAIGRLSFAPYERTGGILAEWLDPRTPGSVQVAALRALAGFARPEVAGIVLARMPRLAPAARAEAVSTLLARGSWAIVLLDAAKAGTADPAAIDPAGRALLLAHPDPEVARRARSLFGSAGPGAGKDVLAVFAPARAMPGDAARGSSVFDRHCAACHRIGGRGHAVGPDLTATQFADAASLLTHILDPNRYVAPNYVQYVVSDRDGRVYTGLIASETAAGLTLRRADGAEDTILRGQIEEMRSTGKSLMPEDFAGRLDPSEAADLVAFLLEARSGNVASRPDGRLDIGTQPGLVEP
jgi:putative heme-binding domain-containing protein